MKYFSTFSGIGGFEIGIRNAYTEHAHIGKESESQERPQGGVGAVDEQSVRVRSGNWSAPLCVGYSEIDKYAIKVYERQFNGHKNYGDITKINADTLPDFDVLVGGFPCQAFSIAGQRRGFKDTRGTLFFDLARILKAKTPRLFVFENVKGLLNHDNGNTFKTIISAIDELGYDCQWQVLNSKNHGVPQNRERIIFVGHLRGTPRPEVFPITGSGGQTDAPIEIVGTLETDGWEKRFEQIRRVHGVEGISPTIPTGTGGGVMTKIAIPVLTPDRVEKRQNGRRFKEDGEPSFTLTGQDKHGIYDGAKIRRLTPLECERLQGFPDNWTKYGEDEHGVRVDISDSQRYKMCGNAVTTNVIQAVFERIFSNER